MPSDTTTPDKLPTVFIGHGSPMHALDDNEFTRTLSALGQTLGDPEAILCISAHWLTAGSWVTYMESPRTIHDFYGFPQALFEVEYPAPGDPELAERIAKRISKPRVQLDTSWGLDHGTWSILKHMYPKANVPVVQLSLDMSEPPARHFELAKQLGILREEGVLIVGSGNIVHNLPLIQWTKDAPAYPWAVEFDEWAKEKLVSGDWSALIDEYAQTEAGRLSVPTLDHYLPMLYTLGASDPDEPLRFEYEAMELGSISLRCFTVG